MLEQQASAVKIWGQAEGLTYPLLLDVNGDVYNQYAKDYLPYFVVLDTDGVVRYTSSVYDETAILEVINTWLPTLVEGGVDDSPYSFRLLQNYPNPFNSSTRIDYELATPSHVTIKIFSVEGQTVRTLASGAKNSGRFTTAWDGRDDAGTQLASGVYIIRLQMGGVVESRKLTLSR